MNLKTGTELWSASASSEEGRHTYDDRVIGLLISAAVKQVINKRPSNYWLTPGGQRMASRSCTKAGLSSAWAE